MKKIYIEKIRQATRFGLVDEDGRKTPCGTLWSDAQRETFERLMNGGNNLAFMAWDSNGGKKMKEELEQHPRYARMYFRATDRMLKSRMEQGKELPLAWGDGKPETVMKWWLEN